jgi:hypothetical protein
MYALSWAKVISFVTLTITFYPAFAGEDTPRDIVPKLNQAQREAIVKAASQAIAKHVKAERKKEVPDEIDVAFWGEAIAKLKPIRVRNDRINLAIVLGEKDGVEEGLCISIPISSYLPRVGDRFTHLTRLSGDKEHLTGTLYHYKLKQNVK